MDSTTPAPSACLKTSVLKRDVQLGALWVGSLLRWTDRRRPHPLSRTPPPLGLTAQQHLEFRQGYRFPLGGQGVRGPLLDPVDPCNSRGDRAIADLSQPSFAGVAPRDRTGAGPPGCNPSDCSREMRMDPVGARGRSPPAPLSYARQSAGRKRENGGPSHCSDPTRFRAGPPSRHWRICPGHTRRIRARRALPPSQAPAPAPLGHTSPPAGRLLSTSPSSSNPTARTRRGRNPDLAARPARSIRPPPEWLSRLACSRSSVPADKHRMPRIGRAAAGREVRSAEDVR